MRAPLLRVGCLLSLLIASSASALTIDWTPVGDPLNACDTQSQGCFGAVGYGYNLATFEVTNAQYAEFLNAVGATDTNALYSTSMGSGLGGISRTGGPGTYSYGVIAGRGDMPVNNVSYYDALRFANWLHNGQLTGAQDNTTTEAGAYTFTGATSVGARNPGAMIFLPTEDEWYKAAYYDGASYFDYPAGFDLQTVCLAPTAVPNTANCNAGSLRDVGSYSGSASPYGTFDQGGNVFEWTETFESGALVMRGGSYQNNPAQLAAAARISNFPALQQDWLGIRVASAAAVPEPGTGLLVLAGLLGLTGWRKMRA
jgi:formylglycine-generating enzyme required for sulfatase activity